MRLDAAEKKEALQSALNVAFGTTGTVLVLECFRIPNSYMALSFAYTLSLLPRLSLSHTLVRILALSLGIIISMLVLIALPEAPWFFMPLVGVIPAFGYMLFFKHSGPGSAYAFSAYFLAFFATVLSSFFSKDFIIQALKLWAQSIIPILVVCLVALVTRDKKPAPVYVKLSFSNMLSMGLAVSIALLVTVAFKSDQAARLVMACISGIATLELEQSASNFIQRAIGYFVGAAFATAFIVGAVALGNDITSYLLALGITFGVLEWFSSVLKKQATFCRAIASMLSFSILMIPAPDGYFGIPYERIINSLIGFFIAIVVFLCVKECSRLTEYVIKKEALS